MSFRASLGSLGHLRRGLCSASVWLAAGCASPGPPQPPSLHLPEMVTDLKAERVGDAVELHWTTPSTTTDGAEVAGGMVAEICRAAPVTAQCQPILRVAAAPGGSMTRDVLPGTLAASPLLLAYRVAILNSRERSAGESSPAFAAAGTAPAEVAGLRGRVVERGALLQWDKGDAGDVVELVRVRQATPVPAIPGVRRVGRTAKDSDVVHLRVGRADSAEVLPGSDEGGAVDESARLGEVYSYTAQRVRSVVLEGKTLELRSWPSASVTINMRSSVAPRAPVGLEAIATAQPPGSYAVDLSWQPNTEREVTGYAVERVEVGAATASVRLTATPVPQPGYRDAAVLPEHRYSYTVRAIGAEGRESAPSAPVVEEVRVP